MGTVAVVTRGGDDALEALVLMRIRERMRERKWDAKELSEASGVNYETTKKLLRDRNEKDKRTLALKYIETFARALDLSLPELFAETREPVTFAALDRYVGVVEANIRSMVRALAIQYREPAALISDEDEIAAKRQRQSATEAMLRLTEAELDRRGGTSGTKTIEESADDKPGTPPRPQGQPSGRRRGKPGK